MDIKQVVKWSVTLIALLVFQYAEGATDELPADVYRVKYDPTEQMPNHLAFLNLMQNLRDAQEESGRDENLAHIQSHLSLSKERSEVFLRFMLQSYDDMTMTNRTITNRMLCTGNKPKYEVNQAYAVLDVLDDIKETNLRKHYKRALVNFGPETAGELDAWLAAIKTGSSHHKYDHQRAFQHSDESVEEVISTACNLLALSF